MPATSSPTHSSRSLILPVILSGFFILAALWFLLDLTRQTQETTFDGERALADVVTQVGFGPRVPGSAAHQAQIDWMVDQLKQAGWQAQVLPAQVQDKTAFNIEAYREKTDRPVILAAHFDTREFAEQDPIPDNRLLPVPGANDGASGVAVLLELARTLPEPLTRDLRLVFFDLEDQGGIRGQNWIEGSSAYAIQLDAQPQVVVILDMIGDHDLNIFIEINSTPAQVDAIWSAAERLGYQDQFIPKSKYSIIDDHTPFLRLGIPAVDVIDFDYPDWHTTADTPDKVSAQSLQIVGETITEWLGSRQRQD